MIRVVITGTGALAPRGISTLTRVHGEVTTGGEVDMPACDDRHERIANTAIDAALAEAKLAASDAGFVWGTGLDNYQQRDGGLQHVPTGIVFTTLARRFAVPRRMIGFACATGTAAIGEAFRLVRSNRARVCVAGGSSTMLGPFYVAGFHALRAVAIDDPSEPASAACKPFDRKRRGFALSDGAAALVVESLASAHARGAEPLAEIVGYGVSQDAFDLNRPPPDGAGALLAMQRAIADAHLEASDVHAVNAHGTGTHAGDIAEAAAIRALFGHARTPVSSLKGAIGHTMAAAGALESLAAIATCRTGIVPPTTNLDDPDDACALDHVIGAPRETGATRVLKTSFGMGGQNAALVIQRFA